MTRGLLLWASTNPWMSERLPRLGFVQRAVRRFMPGESAEDALREAQTLAGSGASTILTLLGENLKAEREAQEVADHYLRVIADVRKRGLDCEISVKLTQLGIDLNPALALGHVRTLVKASQDGGGGSASAAGSGRPLTLWIDMESSAYVDRTLEVYRAVRAEHENVGLALQAYLHRTPADLDALLPIKPIIRLVKGAYLEPETVALAKKREVDAAYQRLAKKLLQERKAGRVGRPDIATHDSRIVGDVTRLARELEMPKNAYEFAMLYGIGVAQQRHLIGQGYSVRILISYGEAWFPWYMRRLAERPANLWFVVKQITKG
jgi:proline dehydrogenase